MSNPDVLVVGGGAIGLTTAYMLVKTGARVTLLERGEPGHEASWAGAGIVPPGNPSRVTAPLDRMRAESAVAFPVFTAELAEASGIDPCYTKCGAFYYHHPDEQLPVAEWQAEGITHEECDVDWVKQREPTVVGQTGYFLPDVAQVRNPRLIKSLVNACNRQGVTIITGADVIDWQLSNNRIVAARTAQDSYSANEFLVCGGAWTDSLMARFGIRFDIRPIRGQIVLYRIDEPGPQYIHHAGPEYLVPRGDGLVLIGSTLEDVGFDHRTTESAVATLRKFAESFAPVLARGRVEKCWAGLRPGSPEGMPSLGRIPGVANLSVAAGHYRWGIAGSPVTGRLLTELLTGREPFMPMEPFSPGRRSDNRGVPVESPQ